MNREILKEAAARFRTPFYVFDIDEAKGEIRRMKEVFPDRVKICFSIKANPFLTGKLADAADFLEACSFGEMRIAERLGAPEEKIVLSGVNKGKEDLLDALGRHEDRILYTAESLNQWEILESFAEKTGKKIRVLPRLTDGSQFGMDKSEIEEILAGEHGKAAQAAGIHYFSGTQKKKIQRTLEELDYIDSCLSEWKERFGFEAGKLEFGSGMAVEYFTDEETMRAKEMDDLAALSGKLQSMTCQGEVTLEFGRRIAATCGTFVSSVADVKTRTGQDGQQHHFAIADGGIHQVSWYGQTMGMKVPPVCCLEKDGERTDWSVFGSLCSMNDVLLRNVQLPMLKTGDHLAFGRCGAYSMTEGISLFLSRDLPQILFWSEEKGLVMVRETMPTDPLNSPSVKL